MDNATIERIEKSFQLLAPRGNELIDRFYATLFSRYPQVRPLFPNDMSQQKQKLLSSLVLVVRNLRNAQQLRSALIDMGKRHVDYGTQKEHYPLVGNTLLEVMGELAGDAWNEQLASDWKAAIEHVASVMLEGHDQAVQAAGAASS